MKIYDYNLCDRQINGEIELVCLADMHIGSPNFNETKLREQIDYILGTPNCVCVIDGDIVDNATKNSVSNIYAATMSIEEQVAYACLLLKPLVDSNKVLAIVEGNHEERTFRESGISLSQQICVLLGNSDLYCSDTAYIFILSKMDDNRDKRYLFKICMKHGSGGGATMGSKASRLENFGSYIDADVYIVAHTHSPLCFKQDYYRVNEQSHTVEMATRLFVNTSAYLNFTNSYAEKKNYKPSSLCTPHIKLKARRIQKHKRDIIYKECTCEL